MKKPGLMGIALLASSPLWAQGVEDLQRRLAEKEAENRRLRERVEMLERELTPRRIAPVRAEPAAPEDAGEDVNRALERALVRENGLLLSPGTFELEPNLVYSHIEDGSSDFRRDSFGPGLVFRMGLPARLQFDAALPYVFERRRDGAASTRSADGIGDLSVGLSRQFLAEGPAPLSLTGRLGYQASTGRNTLFESPRPVALGSGFDALQAGLTAVKRMDPLVHFGSYTFTHVFKRTRNGLDVRPGDSHELRFGTALAVSPAASLRAALSLGFFERTRIEGIRIRGSDDPLAMLEFGGAFVLNATTALDVLVGAGLTGNAPDFRLSIAIPFRF